MPALPPVANTIQCNLSYAVGTKLAITRLHFGYTGGPPTATDLTTIANQIATAWGAQLKSMVGTASNLLGVALIDIASNSGASAAISDSITGTRTGGPLPAGTAVLANYKINRRYRGGKPRTYWPFFTDSDLSGPSGYLAASVNAARTALLGFYGAVIGITGGSTTITDHRNVSYYSGFTVVTNPTTGRARNVPKLRSGGPAVDVIQDVTVSSVAASQRRRNRP